MEVRNVVLETSEVRRYAVLPSTSSRQYYTAVISETDGLRGYRVSFRAGRSDFETIEIDVKATYIIDPNIANSLTQDGRSIAEEVSRGVAWLMFKTLFEAAVDQAGIDIQKLPDIPQIRWELEFQS